MIKALDQSINFQYIFFHKNHITNLIFFHPKMMIYNFIQTLLFACTIFTQNFTDTMNLIIPTPPEGVNTKGYREH